MKKLSFVLIFIIGTSVFGVYGQTKNDDILKLLRISGSDKGGKLGQDIVNELIMEGYLKN
ncbi:MAG: hypothetical protein LBE74_06380 [Treponema sp.]|jgi:hypothetical protein|nr:hypothetical protein [Treponema sp.]